MPFLRLFIICFIFNTWLSIGQTPVKHSDSIRSTEKIRKSSAFVTGYYPIGFFDVDLKYLVKYNNYEAFRFGLGGITNERLFQNFKLGGYVAYGLKDDQYKYSLGGNLRISKETNTWINLYYTEDIQEMGSFEYLTSARIYSVFEPRLINITQFYQHQTWRTGMVTEPSTKLLSEVRISRSDVFQIEDYQFLNDGQIYKDYQLTEASISVRYAPKSLSFASEEGITEYYDGLPKISTQITQGIKGVGDSDFNYTKIGMKLDYYIKRINLSSSHFVLEGNMSFGDIPLTHLYHAYPNNPTKDEILQRFSVAGTQSFETMYFGEFFSSELITFRAKHTLRRFRISDKIKPELVFITRHALGTVDHPEKHLGLAFNTLEDLYSESGLELNRLLFGFGLSFAYRYGAYHLPEFDNNISFKFTFNLKL
jgi:hypothetical protein